ncbi:DUF951 domain-containing protein [Desulfofundulus thermosubterraneus]|uniref:DUF951 domain-containing protein n=1 Tax=Desulfofundulus thermosubterraneus DSM 16057 TaxID=1121432 RepID=A0A1M6D439_9FIRM|nr:DUF951 domain-containing protein [Desulfofundulus thermosubterraneus]SHI67758.1 hypothetical protein SAMN02745219_00810 [Desulfofundulus thermosubterraneus DSM 16057]
MIRFQVGDVVRTRKPHPCGGDQWEVMRTGIDFRIRCLTCGRVVMIPRPKFEKSVRAIVRPGRDDNQTDK